MRTMIEVSEQTVNVHFNADMAQAGECVSGSNKQGLTVILIVRSKCRKKLELW